MELKLKARSQKNVLTSILNVKLEKTQESRKKKIKRKKTIKVQTQESIMAKNETKEEAEKRVRQNAREKQGCCS